MDFILVSIESLFILQRNVKFSSSGKLVDDKLKAVVENARQKSYNIERAVRQTERHLKARMQKCKLLNPDEFAECFEINKTLFELSSLKFEQYLNVEKSYQGKEMGGKSYVKSNRTNDLRSAFIKRKIVIQCEKSFSNVLPQNTKCVVKRKALGIISKNEVNMPFNGNLSSKTTSKSIAQFPSSNAYRKRKLNDSVFTSEGKRLKLDLNLVANPTNITLMNTLPGSKENCL